MLELDLPRLGLFVRWMATQAADLTLEVGDEIGLPRGSIGRYSERLSNESIESPAVRAAISPGLSLKLTLRDPPPLVPRGEESLRQLYVLVGVAIHNEMLAGDHSRSWASCCRSVAPRDQGILSVSLSGTSSKIVVYGLVLNEVPHLLRAELFE